MRWVEGYMRFTSAEVADYFTYVIGYRVSHWTVRDRMRSGDIPSQKFGAGHGQYLMKWQDMPMAYDVLVPDRHKDRYPRRCVHVTFANECLEGREPPR